MKRVMTHVLEIFLLLAVANPNFVHAQAQPATQPVAQAGDKTGSSSHGFPGFCRVHRMARALYGVARLQKEWRPG
jgi:hypothetical protein